MKKNIIILTALVLVGGGVYAFVIRDASPATDTNKTSKTLTTADVLTTTIVTYTDDGFNPGGYLAATNKIFTVHNDSTTALDFASNDHPTHTKNSELNIGSIEPGESKTTTLTKAGEWGFHNHNNPSHTVTITVE